jgi:large subunit ribosomal protein L13
MKIVLDAEGEVVGRIGSYTAKELLKGNEVDIVNAEKAVISGNRKMNVERIMRLRKKGGSSQNGPIVSKLPERLMKRMIRGMLPWDRTKGREAWRRLKCYKGVPADIKDAKKLNFKKPFKFITLEEISKLL